MDLFVSSVGLAGIGLLMLYGIKLIFVPSKNKSDLLKRSYYLLVPICMISVSLVFYQFSDQKRIIDLGKSISSSKLSKVSCNYIWKQVGDEEKQKYNIPLSDVFFKNTDDFGFTNKILIRAGTMDDDSMKYECLKINNAKSFSMIDYLISERPVRLGICNYGVDSVEGVYFEYIIKNIPVVITMLAKEDDQDIFLDEASCIIKKLSLRSSESFGLGHKKSTIQL
ncbi:hypothetical protein IPN35_03995 [Candidatus Peregrinibacteria bacterium]|nr:MAG: hypothetical protein IPN35_03995 [Candidatus Peregrinibacteria bacterium]